MNTLIETLVGLLQKSGREVYAVRDGENPPVVMSRVGMHRLVSLNIPIGESPYVLVEKGGGRKSIPVGMLRGVAVGQASDLQPGHI
mgnify:CR=1 FL=1